jgi:Fe-S-cluster containining protein
MEFNGKIADISIEPKTKRIISLSFGGVHVGFRCQRCAVFCCKLGSPKLLTSDIKRLKQVGHSPSTFLNVKQTSLKNKEDGSCLFLSYNAEEGLHDCSVYNRRPTLCRLYPFRFEKSGPQSYTLNVIPCCNGLNTQNSEPVNTKFFVKFLQEILFDLVDSNTI